MRPAKGAHMKAHVRLAVLFLLVLQGTVVSQGQLQARNGYWWMGASQQFRVGFVTGYATSRNDFAYGAALECLTAKNSGTIPEKYPGREALKACQQTPKVTSLTFDIADVVQFVDGVDELYKDFRNKNIEIVPAMFYVRDELKGKTDKELEDELAGLRRTANQ